jgi:nucleoside-diphosphate-sugar epimerase
LKILVLGSEGQIGKPVCKYLEQMGHKVIRYDLKRSSAEDLRVYDTALQKEVFKNCDFVYYFASDVGGAKYLEDNQNSFRFIEDNILIMHNTFRLLKKYKKPFIFTSSQMSQQFHSTYGNLKLIGEKLSRSLGGIFVRLWNVYGIEEVGEKSHVITDFCNMAKQHNIIKMRTTGSECRQFLYADDCAEALLTLTEKYDLLDKDKNYDITNFEWNSISDVANIIQNISGCEIICGDKFDDNQKNTMNNPDHYILNFWKPKTKLEEGIKKIYYAQENLY